MPARIIYNEDCNGADHDGVLGILLDIDMIFNATIFSTLQYQRHQGELFLFCVFSFFIYSLKGLLTNTRQRSQYQNTTNDLN